MMRHSVVVLVLCLAHPGYTAEQIYDRDPEHSWNRLYRALYHRAMQHRDVEGHVLAPHTFDGQTEAAIRRTHASYAWGLLQGMWPPAPGK